MVHSLPVPKAFGTLLLVAAAWLASASPAKAIDYAWTGLTDANWATATNWSPNLAVPTTTADTATFNAAAGPGGATINTGIINLGTLIFNTASASAYTIGGAAAGTGQITFADGTTNIVTMNSTVAASQLVNANIILGTAIASTSTITNNSTTNTLTFAGNITGGSGGTAAAKTLTLAGAGAITLGGTLNRGGATGLIVNNTMTGLLTLSGTSTIQTLNITQTGAVVNLTGGNLSLSNSGAAVLNSTNSATLNGGTITLTSGSAGSATTVPNYSDFGNTAGVLTVNSTIAGSSGIGVDFWPATSNIVLTGLNTFSGPANINGVVSVSSIGNVGIAGNLGTAGTLGANAGAIGFGNGANSGRLLYTGPGEQTNRTIAFNSSTGGVILENAGTGTLHFTSTASIVSPGAGAKTFTLTGSGSGRFDMVVPNASNGGGLVSLAKTGTGTWILGGVNTYTGTTSVSGGGSLVFTRSQTLTGNVTWNNSGLVYAAAADAALNLGGTLTATGGATAVLGGSIGATTTSARINVAGAATVTTGTLRVNVYGINGVTPAAGSYTLLSATGGLGTFTPTLGSVFNNTNFTVSGVAASATAITATIAPAAPVLSAFWTGGLAGASNVWAASDGTSASNWATTSGGPVQALIPGGGADVTFSSSTVATAPAPTVLGANMTIRSLTIADTANGLVLNNDGYGLTIASAAGIAMAAGVPASTIASNLVAGAVQTWTNNSANPLNIPGVVSGSAAITKSGSGPLTLGGANTFSGGLTVGTASTLNLNSPTALGATASTFTLNASNVVLDNTLGQALTMTANNPIAFSAAATALTFAGTNGANSNLNLGTGAVTLAAATTLSVTNAAASLTLGGTITGAFNIVKNGAGTLSLGTINTATGTVAVNGGRLNVAGNGGTFTGAVTVNGATSVLTSSNATPNGTATGGVFGVASGTLGANIKQITISNGGTFRAGVTWDFNNVSGTAPGNGYQLVFGTGGGFIETPAGITLTLNDGTSAGGTAAASANYLANTGTTSITKIGLGQLTLANQSLFTATVNLNAGLTVLTGADTLGVAANSVSVASGAALSAGNITMTRQNPLTLSGAGLASAPAGALTATASTFTWVGPITIASGGATIGGGGGALTLSNTATINATAGNLTLATGAGALTVNSTISLGASPNVLTVSHGAARLTTAGVISGTASVVVNGTGNGDWIPSGAHTYSGNTTVNAGSQIAIPISSVGIGAGVTSGPFGTGTLILNGGAMRGGTGGVFTIGNTVTLQANSTFYTTGGERTLNFAGPVTITGATRTLTSTVGTTVPGTTIVFQGAIGDGGNTLGIVKAGAGNITFGGANTYTGGTTVNDGMLLVTGSLANTAALSVVPTAATGATLSFINNAANTPANFSSLSLGSATGTTSLGLDLGTASDTIATPAASTVSNAIVFHLNASAGFAAGNYNLITAASGLTAGGATYNLGTVPGGYTYSFNNTDSQVQLNVAAAPAGNRYWRGNANTSWATLSGATTNWATDAAGTVVSASTPGAGDTVIFSAAAATGPAIVTTLDNTFRIDNLQFAPAPTGVTSVAINAGFNPGIRAAGLLTIAPTSASTGITLAQGSGAITIAAPIVLGTAQTWSLDSSTPGAGTASSLTVSGAISGDPSSGLTFTSTAGTSPIVLSAAGSTYSGPSTIAANTIVQGGATNGFSPNTAWTVNGTLNTGAFNQNTGSLVAGAGIVQNGTATNATLTIGSDNLATATFSGTIQNGSTGTLGITKAGTGLQILAGTNTYTGTTTVSGGTLRLGSAVAAVPVAVGGGTLQVAGNLPATATVALSATGTLDLFGTSQTVATLTSVAGNTITNSGSGTTASTTSITGTPSGAGIYVDALTITGAAPALASLITDGPTRKTQVVTNNANTSSVPFVGLTNGALSTFSGGLVLDNNAASGTRLFINAAITGTPFGTGPIIVGQTATDRAGIFFATAGNTLSLPIVVNTGLGTDRFGIRNDGQTITLSGLITANSEVVFSSNSANASNTIITNRITGVGGLALDLSQTTTANTVHTVTLNTAANTNDYAGDTIVGRTNAVPGQNYAATLSLGASDQIPNGIGRGNVILNNNSATRTGTLNLNGFSETINGLSGNGTIDGISGTPTLTIGDNNADGFTFSGILRNTAGTLALAKVGSGTQTLSGASTFAGPVNVNAGLIAFASSPATGGPLGNSTVANLNGGGLSYTATGSNALNRSVVLGAGNGTLNVAAAGGTLTVGSVTSTGGNLVKTGPGLVQLTAASTTLNAGNSGVVVNGGTLQGSFGTGGIGSITVASGGMLSFQNTAAEILALAGTGSLTLAGGSALTLELGASGTNDAILYTTAATSGSITLNFVGLAGFGAGTFNLLNLNTGTSGQLAGTDFVLGSAPVGFNYTITNDGTLVSLTTTASSLIYWNNTQGDGSWANVTGNLGSIGGGAGTNFTSDAAGTIDAGHAPLAGETVVFSTSTVVGPTLTTTLDGSRTIDSLQFNGAGTPAATSVTIAQGSGGSLTLKPASASGGIAILAGGGSATISAPVVLDNALASSQTWSATDAGSTLTLSGNVTFGANVAKTGAGSLTLSGTNSGSGNLSLNAGTLNLNSNGALGTGALNIANGTTLNNTSGLAVTLSGNGPVNINGDFTFTGANSLNLGTGAVTLAGNPILAVNASTLTLGGNMGGTSNLTKAGAGTLTLAGTNTYTGTTFITGGPLRIVTGSALGTTAGGTVQSGSSALELDGSAGAVAVGAESLSINGGGISNGGALRNIAGNNSYGGTITMAGQSRINSDSGTLTLSNAAAVTAANLTLVVGGAGNTAINGAVTLGTGGLIKDGNGTLTLSGTNTYTGTTDLRAGVLNITGSTTGTGNVFVGNNAPGIAVLNVPTGGSLVGTASSTNPTITLGTAGAGSVGVLNITGGTVTLQGTETTDGISFGASNDGYGGFLMSAGTFTQQRFMFGGTSATTGTGGIGVGLQTGGTVNSTGWMILARAGGSSGTYTITGGTLNHSGASQDIAIGLNGTGRAEFNVAGGLVNNTGRRVDFSGGTAGTFSWTGTGALNLNAGTLLTNAIFYSSGTAYVNFNGGTLQAAAANTAFMNAITTGGAYVNGPFGTYAGGAVIDTNTFNATIAAALLAPAGNGVAGVAVTNGGSGYVGAPYVQITGGGGAGAAGYATIDPITGAVTGIVITNPGIGYTSAPTVTLVGGGGSGAVLGTATTAANSSGGLTKLGLGTLTLTGNNTFSGPVDIRAGVLSVSTLANGGSPSGLGTSSSAASNVLLNGGVLDYSGTVAAAIDRNFTFAASNGGLGASGTTAGTFTVNTSAISIIPNLGAANFVLSGTGSGTTGGGTLNGALADGTGTTLSLVKQGTGSWTLGGSDANTYTGTTTVTGSAATAGALILAKTGGALAVPGNLTIGSGTATQAHVLLGGDQQISPTATVTFNGVNSGWAYIQLQGRTQTFGTVVETTPGYGVIETRESAGTFGTSTAIFNVASGTQTYQGYFRDIGTGLDAANSLRLTKTGAGTLQWGAAAGAGAAGTSTSARNYSGGTDIQNGTLQLLPANSAGNSISIVGAGNVSLNGGATFAGTLDLNGLNAGITGLDGTTGAVLGQVVNNVSATTAVLSIGNNGNNGSFAGLLRNNTTGTGILGINKVGAGTQVLTGTNTYTGTTTLTAGILNVGSVETPGTSGPLGNQLANAAGSIILNGGTLQYSAANQFDYSGRFSTAANQQYRGDTNGQNVTWAANLASTGGSLVKSGAGTLTIPGTNTYTGTTNVNAGTLAISGSTNTGAGIVTVGSAAATLNVLAGGSLTTTGTLNLGSTVSGHALIVATGGTVNVGSINNPWGANYTIDGTLTSTGTWTVSTNRTSDTFNGTGTITAAALTFGNFTTGINYTGSGTITITGAITIASNAAGAPSYTQSSGTLNAGSILLGDANTGSRTFNLNGGRVNLGSGGIAATGAGASTRTVNLGAGILGASANWASSLPMTLTAATTPTINTLDSVDNTTPRTITLSGVLSGSGSLTKAGEGTLSLSALNSFSGNVTVNGGVLAGTLAASGGNSAFGASNTSRTITVNTGGTLRFDAGNVFSGNFSSNAVPNLNVVGGTVANAAPATNNALGNVTLADGTLTATVASASGYGSWNLNGTVTSTGNSLISSTAPAPIALSANTPGNNNITTFDVQSGTLTASAALGQVTAAGDERTSGLTKAGAGTMVLGGTNTYTGVTTLAAGVLSVGTIGNGGTSGNLGAATTAAANLVFDGGTLRFTGATESTDRNFTINAGKVATFDVTTAGTVLTVGGTSTASTGGLAKTGAGTLLLTGANPYTGNTTVSGGTLALGATGSIAASPTITLGSSGTLNTAAVTGGANSFGGQFALAAGQTLTGTGTVSGPITVVTNSTVTPGPTPGSLTLTAGLATQANSTLTFGIFDGSNVASAITTGGSSLPSVSNPATSNNFLNVTGGATSIDTGTLVVINAGSTVFTDGGLYSYTVATGAGDQSGTLINAQPQFVFNSTGGLFTGSNYSLTGDNNGRLYVNFTAVAIPEPALLLGLATASLGLAGWVRRRRRTTPTA
jgi:autotransporter-associated beta strand protein